MNMRKLLHTETTANLVVIAMGLSKSKYEGASLAYTLVSTELNKRIWAMENRIYGNSKVLFPQ
jgi:hypothetical protein